MAMRVMTASTVFIALAGLTLPAMAAESSQFLALKNVPVKAQQAKLTDTELSRVEGGDNICVVCANANVQAQILTNKSTQQTGNQTNQR
jgi:hypothetical protein